MAKKKAKTSPIVFVTLALAVAAIGFLVYLAMSKGKTSRPTSKDTTDRSRPNVDIRGSSKRSDACGRARDAFDKCMRRALDGGGRNEEALQTCQSEFITRQKTCQE